MRILYIAFKDVLITLKDKKALALIVLMPIVLIFVLGMGLSSMFEEGTEIERFDAGVVDKDRGEIAEQFRSFLKSEDISRIISISEMDEAEGMEMVKKGDMAALIVLPEGFSEEVNRGNEAEIEIYQDPGSPLRGKIVESLVKSFAGAASAIQTSVDSVNPVFREYGLDGQMILPEVMKTLENVDEAGIRETDVEKKGSLSAMQYYSAAMLVMYILFVASMGTSSIIEEREKRTLMRLMSTTVKKSSILTGKFLGLVFLGVFDVSVLIAFTNAVFGVDWGNSPGGLIVLSLAMIFAASGLAMFAASMFKTSRGVESMSTPVVMVMSFLGGSMFPLFQMPPVLQAASKITLNNWALRGYMSLMLDGGMSSIAGPSAVLCGMGTVFLTAGILRLRLN